jgi:hypothetical protein
MTSHMGYYVVFALGNEGGSHALKQQNTLWTCHSHITSFGHYMITVLSTISCSATSTGSSFIEISFLFLYVDL